MKKNVSKVTKRRLTAILLVTTIVLGLVGCGAKNEPSTASKSEVATNKESNAGKEESTASKEESTVKEVEMPKSLSVWSYVSANTIKAGGTSRGDVQQYKTAEKNTGCKIEWIDVEEAARNEQFTLMVSTGKYPDLINTVWTSVPGGAASYVEDEVIVPISDYLDYMPNLKKFLDENPAVAAQFLDDQGRLLYAPLIRADQELTIYVGPIIRQDWLDKLGLEMPTNTDELYDVLKAFKTQDPNGNGEADEIPFTGYLGDVQSFGVGCIVQSFGTWFNLYIKDGKVTHGLIEPEMKEALAYMSKLYEEELLDQDYLTQDFDSFHAKYDNDIAGFGYTNHPARYMAALDDGTKKLVGVPYFDGLCNNDLYKNYGTGSGVAITTACKDPEGAARWLDYFYSEVGVTAGNYGIEGKTYNVVDGKKVLNMDFFENNPDGLTRSVAIAMNIETSNTNFAGLQLWDAYSQTLGTWGKEAIAVWSESADLTGAMPTIPLTAEESNKVASIKADINAYSSELFNSIIIGNKPLSALDNAEKEMKALGLDTLLEVYNTAYQRFIAN